MNDLQGNAVAPNPGVQVLSPTTINGQQYYLIGGGAAQPIQRSSMTIFSNQSASDSISYVLQS